MAYKNPEDQAAAAKRHYEANKEKIKARSKKRNKESRRVARPLMLPLVGPRRGGGPSRAPPSPVRCTRRPPPRSRAGAPARRGGARPPPRSRAVVVAPFAAPPFCASRSRGTADRDNPCA